MVAYSNMVEETQQVQDFREKFKDSLKDDDLKESVDERDVRRLELDDRYVLCFIHWKKGDVDAAVTMASNVLQWRKEQQIHDKTTQDIGTEIMERGVVFVHGRAIDHTRLVYFIARKQTKDTKPQIQNLLSMWLERLHQLETGKHVTFVLDVSKTSMSNVDLGGIRFILDCFITYFPDMLERILILEMPWIMNAIWKVVKQWMTEEQRKKTVFCKFKDLNQYVSNDNMLQYMGGSDTWEYCYPQRSDDFPQIDKTNHNITSSSEEESASSDESETMQEASISPSANAEAPPTPQSRLVSQLPDVPASEEDDVSTITSTEQENSVDSSSNITEVLTVVMESGDEDVTKMPKKNDLILKSPRTAASLPINKFDETSTTNETYTDSRSDLSGSKRPLKRTDGSMNSLTTAKLGALLVMSPASEVVFREDVTDSSTGKYQSVVTLTNSTKSQHVAYKFRTNSPLRYHVKPSAGCIPAGETVTILINLSLGHEKNVSSDRFLILYQVIEENADVAQFWNEHSSQASRHVHKVRVRFVAQELPKKQITPNGSIASSLPKNASSQVVEMTSTSPDITELKREVFMLRKKLTVSEQNTHWLRTKFHHSMMLQILFFLLLLFIIYQLSVLREVVELVSTFIAFCYNFWPVYAINHRVIAGLPTGRPLNIAHRGSSGMRPEHTVEAYQLAVEQGADVIECDLAVTKDLHLVCTHDAWINATTDVSSHSEFNDRVKTYVVGGKRITNYFTIDFTLEELKTLRKIQNRPYRDQSYNGKFEIATFDEYVAVAQNTSNGRTVGIYPETKVPSFFNSILSAFNTTFEDLLLESLKKHGYTEPSSPCFVQSFSEESLLYLASQTTLPLVSLISTRISDTKLAEISAFSYGVGLSKDLIVQVNPVTMKIVKNTDFLEKIHSYGLVAHPYTFRNENQFLAFDYGADAYREYERFVDLGVDGLFTDYPWSFANYLEYRRSLGNTATSNRLSPCSLSVASLIGLITVLLAL